MLFININKGGGTDPLYKRGLTKTGGFTLIELLVVISIIGILSAVVLASLNTAREKSRDVRRVADIKQFQLALELYFDENSAYPATLTPLAPDYLPVVSTDPDGSNYLYAAVLSGTNCTDYHIGATLEDTAHSALDSDSDASASLNVCTGSDADFAGTDPVFDLKP